MIRQLLNGNFKSLFRMIPNLFFFIFIKFNPSRTIIIGMAPFDARISNILKKCKGHELFYFTSWNVWDRSKQPFEIKNEKTYRLWKSFLEKEISGIFFVSNNAKEDLLKNFRISCDYVIVNHVIDKRYFYPLQEIKGLDELRLLYVGRLTKAKGIEKIIQLIELLISAKIKFDFSFVGDGQEKKKIVKLSKKYGNIKYFGFIKEKDKLGDIYRNSDFLILPSSRELFGIVILEAMSCGVVPITTDNVGPREIIINNKNGIYFREVDYVRETYKYLNHLDYKHYMEQQSECIKTSLKYHVEVLAPKWDKLLQL